MPNYAADKDLFFTGADWNRSRWQVESDKLAYRFPAWKFRRDGERSWIEGSLRPRQRAYGIKIHISARYPYELPKIEPLFDVDKSCHHYYYAINRLCVMPDHGWTKTMSLAFLVGQVAVWLYKYEDWQRNGVWDQPSGA